MTKSQILWIDLQPSMYCLFKRTAQTLSQHFEVKRWSFEHDLDESCDVKIIHSLLRQTIENSPGPVHLIGHGLSGTIAYLYTQEYPKNISSVSLLSVDIQSTNQWTSHYQSMRSQLPCSRFHVLSQLSRLLIDTNDTHVQNIMTRLLAKCLDNDFVHGSILQNCEIQNLNKIKAPLLVINSDNDFVIDKNSSQRWQQNMKPGDCYQLIRNGRHFFPFNKWVETSMMIESFIKMVPDQKGNLIPNYFKNLSNSKPIS